MSMIGSRTGGSPSEVRNFLRADSAEELVRLQLINNIKFGLKFSYTDFRQAQDGKWYCWFLMDMEQVEKDLIDGAAEESLR